MKVKECKNMIQCKPNQKKDDVATLISDEVDFKVREKEEHFIIIKGISPQEDIAISSLQEDIDLSLPKNDRQLTQPPNV